MAGNITEVLQRWSEGEPEALQSLMPLVYNELRRIAASQLRQERDGHTLQSTGLVHEAFLRLAGRETGNWKGRAQFYAVAAQVIRRILVDHARMRGRGKRGGGQEVLALEVAADLAMAPSVELTQLDEALNTLAELDGQQSRIVEMRFFAGLSVEEIAAVLDISESTVKRSWSSARAWLLRELADR